MLNYDLFAYHLKVKDDNLYCFIDQIRQNKRFDFLLSYGLPINSDYKHKNYSLIMSKKDEPLLGYVNNNINQYIQCLLGFCENVITDNEDAVLDILNNTNINEDNLIEYLAYLKTQIQELDKIENKGLWPIVLERKLITCSSSNILNYYFRSERALDNILIDFINDTNIESIFKYDSVREQFGQNEVSKLYKDIISCNDLTDDKYKQLLSHFNRNYNTFSFAGIQSKKVNILIDYGIIAMTKENLLFIRENYTSSTLLYVKRNIKKYTEVIDEGNFVLDELLALLNDKAIKDNFLIYLLKYTTQPISIVSLTISNDVRKYILEHNLDTKDLIYIIQSFSSESEQMKQTIESICVQHIYLIIENEIILPYNLLTKLLSKAQIDYTDKLLILIISLSKLSQVEARDCLESLRMVGLLTAFEGKWPVVEQNETNEQILHILKKKGWISSFAIDKDKQGFFRVRGKRNNEDDLSAELL